MTEQIQSSPEHGAGGVALALGGGICTPAPSPRSRRMVRPRPGREYVLAADMQRVLGRYFERHPHENLSSVARRAGIDRRSLQAIRNGESPYITLNIADKVCVAIGRHISEVGTVTPLMRVP